MSDKDIWVKVADVDDVMSGEGFETDLELNGEIVGVFCIDGEYFALGECSHEQGPLCQGILVGSQVTCPWHSARFDIKSGKCLDAPSACRVSGHVAEGDAEGDQLLPACNTYRVRVENGTLFVYTGD